MILPPGYTPILLPLIVVSSLLLMLIRPRDLPEVWWVGGGAALLVLLGIVPLHSAGKAVAEGRDVYLFLTGMMLLSALARDQGVFDWVAGHAVKSAHGSCSRLFALVYAVGTLVTIFMSNDATAVVLTPAILTAVRRSKATPLPYLFVCALIANAASFVLPISNPANLVVFRVGMPSLSEWLRWFAVPSMLSIAATFLVTRFLFRKELRETIAEYEDDGGNKDVALTINGKLVLIGLAAMIGVLLTASALKKDLGLPTFAAALVITALVLIRSKEKPWKLAREISWGTLLLVAGLFIMVDAVESHGALNVTQSALKWAQSLTPALGVTVIAFFLGIGNNIVNNLPLGLIAGATLQASRASGLIAQAVLLGVDLGPNLSVTGSLATILWLLALRKEGIEVGFWKFLRVGVIAMPVALAAALGGSIAIHMLGHTR